MKSWELWGPSQNCVYNRERYIRQKEPGIKNRPKLYYGDFQCLRIRLEWWPDQTLQIKLGKVDSSLENRDVTAGVKDSGIQYHATSELPAFEEYLKYWNVENLIQ